MSNLPRHNPGIYDADLIADEKIRMEEEKMNVAIHNSIYSNFSTKELKVEYTYYLKPRITLATPEIFYEFVFTEEQAAQVRDALKNFHTQEEARAMEAEAKR